MAISATRRDDNFYIGNFHVTRITKEEYEELLQYDKEVNIGHCFINYMRNAPKELLSKYAKRVRESDSNKNKVAKDIQSEIWSLQSDLNAINELEALIL